VLFERKGRKQGQVAGRSPFLQAVHGEGSEALIGKIVEVDIVSVGPNSLTGVIKSEFEWREPVQAAV
jgi:tRNA-2-methylthio-N6-dimethylallyladenosine synthase